MMKHCMLLVVVPVLSALALAQTPRKTQIGDASASTTTCDVTFTSGTSTNATQFCVTAKGTLPSSV